MIIFFSCIEKRKQQREHNVANKKLKKAARPSTSASNEPTTSTSGESSQTSEIIWQKESDKKKIAANKLKAIELFNRSKGRAKRPMIRSASSRAELSESDSD